MRCFSPIQIKRENAFNQPVRYTVPCGKCMACLATKRQDWTIRLIQEEKASKSAYFVTLTYSDENIPRTDSGLYTLDKRDTQLFWKKLRKKYGQSIKYFITGEYGGRFSRPHYHAIIFNLPNDKELAERLIADTWQNGHIHIGDVTPESISYTCGYIIQSESSPSEVQKSFSLQSKGIGLEYVKKVGSWHKSDMERFYVITEGGRKHRMPRYYRNKIYTQKQQKAYAERQIVEADRKEAEKVELTGFQQYCKLQEELKDKKSTQIKKSIK